MSLTFNFPSSIKAIHPNVATLGFIAVDTCCYLCSRTHYHTKGRKERMSKEIVAPMPGTIINILVNVGDEILEYQEVFIL